MTVKADHQQGDGLSLRDLVAERDLLLEAFALMVVAVFPEEAANLYPEVSTPDMRRRRDESLLQAARNLLEPTKPAADRAQPETGSENASDSE